MFFSSMPKVVEAVQVTLSPMLPSDVHRCCEIEEECFPFPWPPEAFFDAMADPKQRCTVCRVKNRIVGFCIVELSASSHQIANIAVDPSFHRRGIGRRMVLHHLSMLGTKPYMSMLTTVGETSLVAQLFFKSLGFLYISTIHNFFENGMDGYLMQHRIGERRRFRSQDLDGNVPR